MQKKQIKFVGIDYGSKVAGTTVICYEESPGSIDFLQSKKGQDADQMIFDFLDRYKIEKVFMDAPLSLPGVYKKPDKYKDYFYREADRLTRAMSPMFLGGLTARAMRLDAETSAQFFESYPKGIVNEYNLEEFYKKEILSFIASLKVYLNDYQIPVITNWHQVDALLTFLIGIRYLKGNHKCFGTKEEGEIIV
ncbi:MAG: hypothetical protein R3345_06015 [Fulvivirga sp.]|nr:hypothetical protein [Fulvivirga sp.]